MNNDYLWTDERISAAARNIVDEEWQAVEIEALVAEVRDALRAQVAKLRATNTELRRELGEASRQVMLYQEAAGKYAQASITNDVRALKAEAELAAARNAPQVQIGSPLGADVRETLIGAIVLQREIGTVDAPRWTQSYLDELDAALQWLNAQGRQANDTTT